MTRPLRPHQVEALAMLRRSLGSGKRRPMIQAPTGFGKTLLGAAIVEGALAKGKRVTFVVPALSLVDQTVAAFWEEGIRAVGVMQGDHAMTNWSRPVQVASVQTLQRREIPLADIVLIDEAHRWFDFYATWMGRPAWSRVPFVGLSASPWTKGLGRHYDDLLIPATTGNLIEAGYLSRFRVFAPSHPDLSDVRSQAGDYREDDLSEAMQPLVADIVETWLRRAENRPTLCFGVDRAHAKQLEARFIEAGVATAYIDAYTSSEDREAVRQRFHSGKVRVVCNVGCLTTGVDWDVRCIVLARPTKSEMLFTQIIGRGLRTAEGKEDCLVLDHSDTHLRLGFVTDIHHDSLDDGAGRQKRTREAVTPLPKECPKCTFLKPARVALCPACGFKPVKQSGIECEDGELVEVGLTAKKLATDEKQSLYGQLRVYARHHGYSDGWIAHKFRERTGVWPNHHKNAPDREPTGEIMAWIRSRQIAYAKSRGGRHAAAAE